MSSIQLEIMSKAIGPAPWYFETFPTITGSSGSRYLWLERWVWEPDAKLVVLGPEPGPGPFRLAVHMYVRAFPIPPAKVGVWYERNGKIRIFGFDPDRLADFSLSEVPTEFKDPRKWLHYAIGKPEFELELDLDLPEGVHRLHVPAALQSMDELLLVATRPPAAGVNFTRYEEDDPAYAIWALQPAKGQVQVFPQKWFTATQFDLGYEWITRVARDPETGRLIGDGIRIGAFELAEDGCHLDHWLAS